MTEPKDPLKVFLYHAAVDRIAVRDLYLRLIKDGVDALLVKEKILPGQDWKQELHRAVSEADVVMVCVSGGFNRVESQQREVQAAFDSTIKELDGKTFVIPVRLEECDRLENLRKWQWVDLFEEAGYEKLIHALQAKADEIGAILQAKESSLPQTTISSVKQEQTIPEEKPVEANQTVLDIVEGAGILMEAPAAELQEASRRKLRQAMLLALIGLLGSMVAVMFRFPQLERWYQLTFTSSSEMTPTPAAGTETKPVVVAPTQAIPTLVSKGNISHIVFLIDTSGSMQGQRIRMVRAAASRLVARLRDDYLISVIEFDTNVELRMSSTHDYAAVSEAIQSISVEVPHNGSCIRDAIYAAVQQASVAPITNDSGTMVIFLTDVALDDHVELNCSIRFLEDLIDLAWTLPVPVFSIYLGEQFDDNSFVAWTVAVGQGATLTANNEKEIDNTLLSISQAAGLELSTELVLHVGTTDTRHMSMVFVPPGEFIMGNEHRSTWMPSGSTKPKSRMLCMPNVCRLVNAARRVRTVRIRARVTMGIPSLMTIP